MPDHVLLVIVAVGIITYMTRIAGFTLGAGRIPLTLYRFLTDVPVAAFAALAIPGILIGENDMPARVTAALVAGVITLRFGKLWLCILTGLATYWAAHLAYGL
jgi:branched-subunit amino acid transport protein